MSRGATVQALPESKDRAERREESSDAEHRSPRVLRDAMSGSGAAAPTSPAMLANRSPQGGDSIE